MHTPAPTLRFADLLGQPKAKELLRRAVLGGRPAHALLFRGPRGVGKRSMALVFAAFLNCPRQEEGEPCGRCPSCLRFRSGNHPDLLRLAADGGAIKIEQVRELKKALTFPPLEARFRVAILPDIHAMRREAANSLLKTLEEPPSHTILVLTGDQSGEILPTILSRCQVIPFFSLPREELTSLLASQTGLAPETAATLAAAAEGSLGRALVLHQQGLLDLRRRMVEALLRSRPDSGEAVQAILPLAEEAAELKEELPELLDLLSTWLRDLLLQRQGSAVSLANPDLRPLLAAGAARWSPEEMDARLSRIDRAKRQLARNCNAVAVSEVLLLSLL
ncbi:MAG: DNA polymerase III subunit delta' [Thermodesulfobacteriota bacterium]